MRNAVQRHLRCVIPRNELHPFTEKKKKKRKRTGESIALPLRAAFPRPPAGLKRSRGKKGKKKKTAPRHVRSTKKEKKEKKRKRGKEKMQNRTIPPYLQPPARAPLHLILQKKGEEKGEKGGEVREMEKTWYPLPTNSPSMSPFFGAKKKGGKKKKKKERKKGKQGVKQIANHLPREKREKKKKKIWRMGQRASPPHLGEKERGGEKGKEGGKKRRPSRLTAGLPLPSFLSPPPSGRKKKGKEQGRQKLSALAPPYEKERKGKGKGRSDFH